MGTPFEIVQTVEYGAWRKLCFMEQQLLDALAVLEDNVTEEEWDKIYPNFFDETGCLIRLQVHVQE